MSAPVSFLRKKSVMELLNQLRPDEHPPLTAMVEVADRCNETCVHCYQVQGQKGELDTEQWKRIFDELAELGVLLLTISGGEATLRRDFLELVEHARARRFAVKIYTNGLRVDRAMAQRLGELAVQEVQISLYSPRPDVHDSITRVPGSFGKTVAAVRHLREAGVAVMIKTPLMKDNSGDMDAYIELARSIDADFAFDPTLDPREDGDATPEALAPDDAELVRARRHEVLRPFNDLEGFERSLEDSVCGACSGSVHVEANGEMRPCTQLQVPVGHALEDGVRAAWEGNETGRSIRRIQWKHLHGCRDCDLRHVCGRCFARARVEAEDALAPYRSACAKAKVSYELTRGVAPRIEVGTRRDVALGPYRHVEGHVFETIDDVRTDEDRARAAAEDWISPPRQLVQIRRRTVRREGEDLPRVGEPPLKSDGSPLL